MIQPESHGPDDSGRRLAAAVLSKLEPIRIDQQHAVSATELVSEMNDFSRYKSEGLTRTDSEMPGAKPKHWIVLLPSPYERHGLNVVEFGLGYSDVTVRPDDEARFDNEFYCDERLDQLSLSIGAAATRLYESFGGFLVNHIRGQGDNVFAALEICYAQKEGEATRWARLVYSLGLLETARILREKVKGGKVRPWVQRAMDPANYRKTAKDMAVSAVIQSKKLKD